MLQMEEDREARKRKQSEKECCEVMILSNQAPSATAETDSAGPWFSDTRDSMKFLEI
jgi:hypothetical protein